MRPPSRSVSVWTALKVPDREAAWRRFFRGEDPPLDGHMPHGEARSSAERPPELVSEPSVEAQLEEPTDRGAIQEEDADRGEGVGALFSDEEEERRDRADAREDAFATAGTPR